MDVTGEQLHALAHQLRNAAEMIDRIAAAADAGVQVSFGNESSTAHLMSIFHVTEQSDQRRCRNQHSC